MIDGYFSPHYPMKSAHGTSEVSEIELGRRNSSTHRATDAGGSAIFFPLVVRSSPLSLSLSIRAFVGSEKRMRATLGTL
jgi:hypothetical protein